MCHQVDIFLGNISFQQYLKSLDGSRWSRDTKYNFSHSWYFWKTCAVHVHVTNYKKLKHLKYKHRQLTLVLKQLTKGFKALQSTLKTVLKPRKCLSPKVLDTTLNYKTRCYMYLELLKLPSISLTISLITHFNYVQ